MQYGSCAFGDECYKLHVLLPDADPEDEGGQEEAAPVPEPEPQSVPVCEYFHRGKCTFGDNCVKSHDPLPLYKKDLKGVVLRTAAEVAAENKAAGRASTSTTVVNSGSKVKTELVKIVKNRTVTPAAARQSVNYNNNNVSSGANGYGSSRNIYNNASSNTATSSSSGVISRNTDSFIMSGVSIL